MECADSSSDSDESSGSCRESADCSDEGVSIDDDPQPIVCSADLSQIQLDASWTQDAEPTKYSENGTSTKRIKGVLKHGCKCKKKCVQALGLQSLQQACKGFWRLEKGTQDVTLWSLGRASSQQKRVWKLNGTLVCRKGLCLALGIGRKRLSRVSHTFRGIDLRGSPAE